MTNKNEALRYQYIFSVWWSEDDKEYVGVCDEFPSLSWVDKTHIKALQGIIRLVSEID